MLHQRSLGISLYPGHSDLKKNFDYIEEAASLGFRRAFTCLISLEETRADEMISDLKQTVQHANKFGIVTIVDVAPSIFDRLGISYKDLSFFADLGVAGFRLDLGFSGIEESLMTFNPHQLIVELNMYSDTHYVDMVMDFKPKTDLLWACHNFYPHRYTAAPREHFLSCSRRFKKHGLRTAAFVNSQVATFGPWPVSDGLCTLEEHRDWSIRRQAQDLFASGLIDDVIISNCYPSTEELRSLSSLDPYMIHFEATLHERIPAVERAIVLEELHFNRGDINEALIRSTQSRVKYKGHDFKIFHAPPTLHVGDIIIESSLYGHYAGELQLVRQEMPNSGRSNVVGHIQEDQHFLLESVGAWDKFRIKLASEI